MNVLVSSFPIFTFEYGADVLPNRDAAAVVKLTQGQLHVEERHAAEHRHQEVGQQEGAWGHRGRTMTGDRGQT